MAGIHAELSVPLAEGMSVDHEGMDGLLVSVDATSGAASDSGSRSMAGRVTRFDSIFSRNSLAVCRPSRRISSLRAAISMRLPMLRPGRTGTFSSRMGVPRIVL